MATYEGTTDHFLREFGARVRDFSLNDGSDGSRISRARAMEVINLSISSISRRLRRDVNSHAMTRRATLTQSSSDTTIWYLPGRMQTLLNIEDSNTTQYVVTPMYEDDQAPGVFLERRPGTTAKQLKFVDVTPDTTVYARVVERPVLMSGGTNATTATTSLTLATTPHSGRNINDANYYANADICITSGNNAGDIQTISASTIALVCTVAEWTTATPTAAADTYSIICSLPPETWEAILADAAVRQLATDKEIVEFAEELKQEAQEAYIQAALAIHRPMATTVKEPREVVQYED